MEELVDELEKSIGQLEDFSRYKHLFSDDDAERELAELRQNLGRISFLLKAGGLKEVEWPKTKALKPIKAALVKIRPCAEEYENKTYAGFLLGDIALGSTISITDEKISCEFASYNPAIFVPELGKVIYGCESWWGQIKSVEELKEITDEDIDNVWYVKALMAQMEKANEVKDAESE